MALIPMDDRDGFIWLDGKIVPWRDAKIHVLTHGLHYASSVFEGNRAYNGHIFKLRDHSERLLFSARRLGMEPTYSADQIDAACIDILKANGMQDGYVRPLMWRGAEQLGVAAQQTKIHFAVACWEWGSYFSPELREKGIRLGHASWRRPAPDSAPTDAKAAGLYMICTMSKHDAEAQGYHDALMLDYRGFVAEATGANVFFVMDGKIHTPLADCFLNGITRRTVITLAREKGFEVIERHIQPEEITQAQEVFLTGTAAELTAVGEVFGHHYQVGAITRQLRDDYATLVRSAPAQDVAA